MFVVQGCTSLICAIGLSRPLLKPWMVVDRVPGTAALSTTMLAVPCIIQALENAGLRAEASRSCGRRAHLPAVRRRRADAGWAPDASAAACAW